MKKDHAKQMGYILVTSSFGVTGGSVIPVDFHPLVAIAAVVIFALMLAGDIVTFSTRKKGWEGFQAKPRGEDHPEKEKDVDSSGSESYLI